MRVPPCPESRLWSVQDAQHHYLDYDTLRNLCEAVKVLVARPLFIGRYEEALEYPMGFESHVPGWLGLPALAGNKAEGIVLKPVKDLWRHTCGRRRRTCARSTSRCVANGSVASRLRPNQA